MKNRSWKLIFQIFGVSIILAISNNIANSSNRSNGKKLCYKSDNSCDILCRNWDLNSIDDTVLLKEIINADEEEFAACTLILENCWYSNHTKKIWREIFPGNNPKIIHLKIFNGEIDVNKMELKSFRNLRSLTLKNTTTTVLSREIFRHLPKLQKLRVKKNNLITSVEECLLNDLTINYLQIQGINLHEMETGQFFRNLTCGQKTPSIRKLDWSHNNFGNFTKDLLVNFPNINSLILTNSNIVSIEEGTFRHSHIRYIFLNKNKIGRLSKTLFRSVAEKATTVSLGENMLICDCEMKWLQNFVKKNKNVFRDVDKITCESPENSVFLETEMCPKLVINNTKHGCMPHTVWCPLKENWTPNRSYNTETTAFAITANEPEYLEISVSNMVYTEKIFLWYVYYSNVTSPEFNCIGIFKQNFTLYVKPDVIYVICLGPFLGSFDCLPIKTKPLQENQTWLTNKRIPLAVGCFLVAILVSLIMGALILYFTVHKNPSLIRSSKRVIEVKTHDRAQVLIMPRGYVSEGQTDNSPVALNQILGRSTSSLNSDTISTVSYVSAIQPTQLEILTYRFNRLWEAFQNNNGNNLPPPIPLLPVQIFSPRLPPNVDLLFEYEWYTVTTTSTTEV